MIERVEFGRIPSFSWLAARGRHSRNLVFGRTYIDIANSDSSRHFGGIGLGLLGEVGMGRLLASVDDFEWGGGRVSEKFKSYRTR